MNDDSRRMCVIYARYSSTAQRDASIAQQVAECERWCAANDWTVLRTYEDRALSGRSDDRPEFLRMVDDAKSRAFDAVVVYKLDRFSRNAYDSAVYKKRLRDCGVRVLSAMENIPDSPEGALLESVITGVAEWYSADLSQKTLRGMRDNARRCMHNGVPVFGYRFGGDGRYEIDPEQASLVRLAFQMAARGRIRADIMRELRARGARTVIGSEITLNWVQSRLNDERYVGTYRWGDVVVPGGMPAIVTREEFDAVHDRTLPRWSTERMHDYPLVGALHDAETGKPYWGYMVRNHQGREYTYYACGKGRERRLVRQRRVDDAVADAVAACLSSPDVAEQVARRIVARCEERARGNGERSRLQKRLGELQKAHDGIMAAIEQGMPLDGLMRRAEALRDEREAVERALSELPPVVIPTVGQVVSALGHLADHASASDILHNLVRSATLDRDAETVVAELTIDSNPVPSCVSAGQGGVRTESVWLPEVGLPANVLRVGATDRSMLLCARLPA